MDSKSVARSIEYSVKKNLVEYTVVFGFDGCISMLNVSKQIEDRVTSSDGSGICKVETCVKGLSSSEPSIHFDW